MRAQERGMPAQEMEMAARTQECQPRRWGWQPRVLQEPELPPQMQNTPSLLQESCAGKAPPAEAVLGSLGHPGLALVPKLSIPRPSWPGPGGPGGPCQGWQVEVGTHREGARRAPCPEP